MLTSSSKKLRINGAIYRTAMMSLIAVALSLFCAHPTRSQTLDDLDPPLFVSSDVNNTGGDPNVLNPSTIYVGYQDPTSVNAHANAPLLIIVAVPTSSPTPTLSNVTLISGTFYGLNFTAGLNSAKTLTSGQNVYTQLNLPGNNSQNFYNYTTVYDANNGITSPTSFTLDVFAVNCALGTVTCTGPITMDIHNYVAGTFISAFNCETVSPTSCTGHYGAVPFTRTGVITTTNLAPEPASMLLFGTGLFAIGGILRRRKSQSVPAIS
jgi:PEP-CTERM motif